MPSMLTNDVILILRNKRGERADGMMLVLRWDCGYGTYEGKHESDDWVMWM